METNIYNKLINVLMDMGKMIAETSKNIVGILSDPIIQGIGGQNYTIIEFMIGAFFVIYVPYQIIKWVIPV